MAWNVARRQAHRTRTLIRLYGSSENAKKAWAVKLKILNKRRKILASELAQLDFNIASVCNKIEEK